MCRSAEVTTTQMKIISDQTALEDIHQVKVGKSQNGSQRNPKNDTATIACKFCAGKHPQRKEKCPAWGRECLKCGGKNHFARACRKIENRNRSSAHRVTQEESHEHGSDTDTSDFEYLGSVAVNTGNICAVEASDGYLREIYAEMLIDGKPVQFQVDCGASINIIPEELIGNQEVSPTTKTLIMWNKTEVKPKGTVRIIMKNPKTRKRFSLEFILVRECLTPLIGAKAAQQMKLITIHSDNFVSVTAPKREDINVNQLLQVNYVKRSSFEFLTHLEFS